MLHSWFQVLSTQFLIRFSPNICLWPRLPSGIGIGPWLALSSPVPLKTRRVGKRCTLNLSRAETSSRWCGMVVRRGGASSGVVHVT
ncbi:hypothetical protein TNCV_903581 [Trichonephila clavipes]|nr:hypothetical protein TNCV_903581 [Trichonephila clavipes]